MDLDELYKTLKFDPGSLTGDQIDYLLDLVEDEIEFMKDIVI